MSGIQVIGVEGIGEVSPGDDLAGLIAAAADLQVGDVVVVTQKIVSKAEGQLVADRRHRPVGAQGRSSRPRRCGCCGAAATW